VHNSRFVRPKKDRRDSVSRASTSQCPSCGGAEPTVLTRTIAAVYFGCDLCSHLWSFPKRALEASAQWQIEFLQTD